ncbi:MAG: hypothetical protein ACTSRZ_20145, partial [Promethearchaeota archaeon]
PNAVRFAEFEEIIKKGKVPLSRYSLMAREKYPLLFFQKFPFKSKLPLDYFIKKYKFLKIIDDRLVVSDKPADWDDFKNINPEKRIELFTCGHKEIILGLASSLIATDFEEYRIFFNVEEKSILKLVAANEGAVKFKEFEGFFESNIGEFTYYFASNKNATKFEIFGKLFNYKYYWKILASNQEAVKFSGFRDLFDETELKVLEPLARNPKAVFYEDYIKLFYKKEEKTYSSEELELLNSAIASNPNAIRFKEFYHLFWDDSPNVLKCLALNPNAVDFILFRNFYTIKYWSVRDAAYRNQEAKKLYPKLHSMLIPREYGDTIDEIIMHPAAKNYKEYEWLFLDEDPKLRAVLASKEQFVDDERFSQLFNIHADEDVLVGIISNARARQLEMFEILFNCNYESVQLKLADLPDLYKYKGVSNLFNSHYESVRVKMAMREDMANLDDYGVLFSDESEDVRIQAASNRNAPNHKEYFRLFKDKNLKVIKAVISNPNSHKSKHFSEIFSNEDIEVLKYLAQIPASASYNEFIKLLFHRNYHVRRHASRNPNAKLRFSTELERLFPIEWFPERWDNEYFSVIFNSESEKYDEFRMLFNDEIEEIRILIASHPSITKYKEASALFKDNLIKVRQRVARNEEAVKIKGYEQLFDDIAEVRKFVASNIEAVKFPQFKKLFSDPDPNVRRRLAVNWNAVKFKEYKELFNDENDEVKRWVLKNVEAKRAYPAEYEQLRAYYYKELSE